MEFVVVGESVLTVFKKPIPQALGGADHFYLASTKNARDTLGWGPQGIELVGTVRVTALEIERVEKFMKASKYSISVHNCEHFANYVLHGISHSRQMYNSFKQMGAKVVEMLRPVQSASENYSETVAKQVAYRLNEHLRMARIDRANSRRVEFWSSRGIECD